MEASRCAYKRNIILNSVCQHNYFITQGTYIGYLFRLLFSHLQAYFCHLSHKMLCTLWDPSVFTYMEYIILIFIHTQARSYTLSCSRWIHSIFPHSISVRFNSVSSTRAYISEVINSLEIFEINFLRISPRAVLVTLPFHVFLIWTAQ